MSIRDILDRKQDDIITVSGDCSVVDAIAILARHRIGALPVVEYGSVKGIFSERDVVSSIAADGEGVMSRKVTEVMTAPAYTIDLDTGVLAALGLMTERRFRHLPVIDDGNLVGFVSIGDLVKYRIEKIEEEASALREYIQTA